MPDSHPVLNRIPPPSHVVLGRLLAFFVALIPAACLQQSGPPQDWAERSPPGEASLVWWRADDARLVTARLSDTEATPLSLPVDLDGGGVPDAPSDRACQKCHALAAGLIAFTYFGIDGQGGVASFPEAAAIVPNSINRTWNFSALHRNGDRLVTNTARRLEVRDVATGIVLTKNAAGREAAQPAFAAETDQLVFLSDLRLEGAAATNEIEHDESSLWMARLDGDTLADIHLLAAGAGQTLAYPALSPDGRYAVYTRAPYSQSARAGEPTPGRLELLDVQTGAIRPLLAADPAGRAWMPSLLEAEDGLWMAFVSRAEGRPDLRIAPLDPERMGDPSGPARPLPAATPGALFPRFVPRASATR